MDPKKKLHVDEIRKVHKNLRKEFQKETNFMKVWESHCSDDDALRKYAKSMQELATGIWDEDCDGTHRIEWCRKTCDDYFHNGGLEKLLEKDQRRRAHYAKDESSFIRGPSPLQPLSHDEAGTDTGNAALMKRWKNAIEAIGFQRIVYSKDTHLHLMAFRKVPRDFLWDKRRTEEILGGLEEDQLCLNIPQDFREYEDSETDDEFDEDFVMKGINELPQL